MTFKTQENKLDSFGPVSFSSLQSYLSNEHWVGLDTYEMG